MLSMSFKLHILKISAIVSLAVGVILPATAQRYKSISFSRQDFVDTVKIKIYDGALIVPVEIEGTVRHLLFDTGAQDAAWIGEQEAWMTPSGDSLNLVDATKTKRKKALVKMPPMKIGNTTIENYTMVVEAAMSDFSCGLFDGLLAFDLVARGLSFKFDTKDSIMIVTDRKGFFAKEERGQPTLKYTPVRKTRPLVPVKFPFGRIDMLFDSGYLGGWFDLPQPLINYWWNHSSKNQRIINELTERIDTLISAEAGLYGYKRDTVLKRLLRFPELKAGDITLKDVWISTGSPSRKMGSAIMEHASLIIDAPRNRFVFLPHDGSSVLEVGNMYHGSVSLIPADEGDTLGAIKVVVRKDSKSYEKGLRTGDYLISVDGIPIPDMCTYIKLWRQGKVKKMLYRSLDGEEKIIEL